MQKTKLQFLTVLIVLFVLLCFSFLVLGSNNGTKISKADSTEENLICDGFEQIKELHYFRNNLYVVDSGNNTFVNVNLATKEKRSIVGYETKIANITFQSLSNGIVGKDDNVFLTDSKFGIKEFDKDFIFVDTSANYKEHNMLQIIDLANDFQGNVFALEQSVNGKTNIYKGTSIQSFDDEYTLDFVVENDAQIFCFYIDEKLMLRNGKKFYFVDGNGTVEKLDLSANTMQILDCKLDYKNNINLLCESGETRYIQKYVYSNDTYSKGETFAVENEVVSYDFDYDSGDVFVAYPKKIEKVLSGNFIDCLDNFEHPVNFQDTTNILTSEAKIANIESETKLYKQPIALSELKIMEQNSKVILLYDEILNTDFAYVLSSQGGQLVAGYVLKSATKTIENQVSSEFEKGRIINNRTKIYKYPTTLNYDKQNDLKICDMSAQEIKILSCAYGYVDENGNKFYAIDYQNKIAYIKQNSVVELQNKKVASVSTPNAKIIVPANAEKVKIWAEISGLELLFILTQDQLVYVDESKGNEQFVKVSFLNGDNELIEGFVQKENVEMLGISKSTIYGVAFAVLAFVLLVVIIIHGAKHRKKCSKQA